MRRSLQFALLLGLLLTPRPAAADPGIKIDYRDELLRVTLDGSYAGIYYRVWRSGELLGENSPLNSQFSLCTGDCFLTDQEVTPGKTYYYRFELQGRSGQLINYGPYAVVIPDTPVGSRVQPNPSSGAVRVELSLPGSQRRDTPVLVDARVIDVQGRTVRRLTSGALRRGITTLDWDGRGDDGRTLEAGLYFVRLSTPLGGSTTRVVRFR